MKLDDAQKRQVAEWIQQGLKLSEIQSRIASQFGVSLTYMDVRFLVDDLKVMPKDPEPVKAPEPTPAAPAAPAPAPAPAAVPTHNLDEPAAPAGTGSVSVSVDQLARPGALVSGKVKFSDGQTADWSLDQMGRLGLVPAQKGYRPSPTDVQLFQQGLQDELARMGF
jgi:hypothetical protein